MWKWFYLSALLAGAAAAADRPDLNGTWQLDPAHSQFTEDRLKSETLEIQQKEDSIQISEALTDPAGKERKSDVQCNTAGKECKLKGEQVSFWYNGPILVMMETRKGNEVVTKTSLKLDGETLSVEVVHIAPAGEKNETLTFRKQKG
ncbi:MAG TPA: hypothetical protein VGH38_29845, partial [Bryobacteraceae bacterium]